MPDQWKMVPVEPTPEMVEAGRRAIKDAPDLSGIVFENTPEAYDAYEAMLQAAPTPPPLPSEEAKPHASDCAVNNAPAYPAGLCDCGADLSMATVWALSTAIGTLENVAIETGYALDGDYTAKKDRLIPRLRAILALINRGR